LGNTDDGVSALALEMGSVDMAITDASEIRKSRRLVDIKIPSYGLSEEG